MTIKYQRDKDKINNLKARTRTMNRKVKQLFQIGNVSTSLEPAYISRFTFRFIVRVRAFKLLILSLSL
jgi:hypothetical protein